MIGSIILSVALACSFIASAMYFLNYRGYKNTLDYARLAYHAMAMLVIIAAALLEYLMLTHQYEFKYIYEYSSNHLPKGFLLATFWAGQEGSFMLWLLLTSIIGLILQHYSSKRGDLEPRVMSVFALATTFILVMVSPLFKNPFVYIWAKPIFLSIKNINASLVHSPVVQNFLFSDGANGKEYVKMSSQLYGALKANGIPLKEFIIDGRGLNPQLTNFWMQIHPPILFTGFSMATVPFSFGMAAMMKNDYKDWVRQAFPWMLATAGILGLGIMLGGYWAYEMLGWGGYWAWDPVENSSFIPWLVCVAGIHTLLVQRKSQAKGDHVGRYAKTNLILAVMIYVLVIYSTFLTRSGVLGDASVHSFVNPGTIVYLFLIIFVGTFLLLGLGTLAYRWKYLTQFEKADTNIFSRELSLFTAAVVLCTSAAVILIGTSAPIFGHSVDATFYNRIHIPIAIIIGLLNGGSLLLKWKSTKGQDIIRKSMFSVSATIIATSLIVLIGGVSDIMVMLLILSTLFALIVNLEIIVKIIRGNKRMLGAYIAHVGIAIFLLGVISSSIFTRKKDIDLVKDQAQNAFGYRMIFTGYRPVDNNSKYAFDIDLKKGNKEFTVSPIMYISNYNNGLMRQPAILNMLTKDFYISPLGYDDGTSQKTQGQTVSLNLGQKTSYDSASISYTNFIAPDMSAMAGGSGNFQVGADLTIIKNSKTYKVKALMKKIGRSIHFVPVELKDANLKIQLVKIDPSTKNAKIIFSKINDKTVKASTPKEVLSISASTKPFINFVWSGVLIMVFGFFISVSRRLKESML